MYKLLEQKYKNLVCFNFINSFDYSLIIDKIFNNKSYILSIDFIPEFALNSLKRFFIKYNQIEFNLFTQFGYDYWNLENVNVFQYNNFLYQTLSELDSVKEFYFDYSQKTKDFSVFVGSNCRERFDFLSSIGYIGSLKNSNYSLREKNITHYKTDSGKYEFLFGENFENYQKNFLTQEFDYISIKNFSKYNHKNNFSIIKELITESYFYIGLDNMPFTGKDNVSEKSLYGYMLGIPTFNVIGPEGRSMLTTLGFKSTPLCEIEKNYNKKTYDETLIEYMKDVCFLTNLSTECWNQYYIINQDTIYHNYNNLNNAFEIIKNNIYKVLDS